MVLAMRLEDGLAGHPFQCAVWGPWQLAHFSGWKQVPSGEFSGHSSHLWVLVEWELEEQIEQIGVLEGQLVAWWSNLEQLEHCFTSSLCA